MAQTFVFEVGPDSGSLTEVKCPSAFEWSFQRVSAAESGRTDDALMHVNQVAVKRKVKLAWTATTPSETAAILQAFLPEYIYVKYFDPMDDAVVTKCFYTGDMEAPVKIWTVNNKLYEEISFDIIER